MRQSHQGVGHKHMLLKRDLSHVHAMKSPLETTNPIAQTCLCPFAHPVV
jgi:hypothetical protein